MTSEGRCLICDPGCLTMTTDWQGIITEMIYSLFLKGYRLGQFLKQTALENSKDWPFDAICKI